MMKGRDNEFIVCSGKKGTFGSCSGGTVAAKSFTCSGDSSCALATTAKSTEIPFRQSGAGAYVDCSGTDSCKGTFGSGWTGSLVCTGTDSCDFLSIQSHIPCFSCAADACGLKGPTPVVNPHMGFQGFGNVVRVGATGCTVWGAGYNEACVEGDTNGKSTCDAEPPVLPVLPSSGTSSPGTMGDPHFLRFQHNKRDSFHGECDLLLISSPASDMAIHIRTTIATSYSYVEQVALQIGQTVLEFHKDVAFIDGDEFKHDDVPQVIPEGALVIKVPQKGSRIFEIKLTNGLVIRVKAGKNFMAVKFDGDMAVLADSYGLLGEYSTGNMIGRDGTQMDNYNDFGFEWQIRGEDGPMLFMEARAPQWPIEQCRMPTVQRTGRRLRATNHNLYEAASKACNSLHPDDVDLCIDDVMMTGHIEAANEW